MDLTGSVIALFLLALAAPLLTRVLGRGAGWCLAAVPLGLAIYFAKFLEAVAAGHPVQEYATWIPSLGINLSMRLDGLALLFALLICGIGALILVYAGSYLSGHPLLGRFYAFLLMFMASMLGVVLADNLLLLFVFWELTSLSSYLLIGFNHERPEARAAALQALLVTGGGGLALMAGLLLLAQMGGSMDISALPAGSSTISSHALYVPCLLLILAGAFTKSAQFPFHFWLPNAMEAPTPASAYLHSATMVKAGIYLLARLTPALGGTALWYGLVSGTGAVTMVIGAVLALVQTDLKRILAYSTISALGMLTFLLGLGGDLAVSAALAFLLAHALYKGALFLVAGAVDHEAGTRDIGQLGGLARVMPLTTVAAIGAAISMAGLPPLFGFIAKEMVYEATLGSPAAVAWTSATVISSACFVAIAVMVGIRPFLGSAGLAAKKAHEGPVGLWLGGVTLAAISLILALWPQLGAEALLSSAVKAVLVKTEPLHLALWHGVNSALVLSGLTLLAGLAVYAARGLLCRIASTLQKPAQWGPNGWYTLGMKGLNTLAWEQTRVLQSGYLRFYLLIILITSVALAGGALLWRGNAVIPTDWSDVLFYEVGLVVLILLGTLATLLVRGRLAAISALGVVGYSVALIFVLYGAPDLAMTQFLVETLTVILFVLVFLHLPEPRDEEAPAGKFRDLLVAGSVGALMTALVLIAADAHYYPSISEYFKEFALSEGHGRNIVNVILVDFRALDTMGEITVLSVAGVGVYGLLKLRPKPVEGYRHAESADILEDSSVPSVDPQPAGEARMSARKIVAEHAASQAHRGRKGKKK